MHYFLYVCVIATNVVFPLVKLNRKIVYFVSNLSCKSFYIPFSFMIWFRRQKF